MCSSKVTERLDKILDGGNKISLSEHLGKALALVVMMQY